MYWDNKKSILWALVEILNLTVGILWNYVLLRSLETLTERINIWSVLLPFGIIPALALVLIIPVFYLSHKQ